MDRPSIKDCFEYCNNMEQSIAFYNYFESIDWLVGKKGNAKPMVNWRSALTNWVKRSKPKQSKIEKALSNQGNSVSDHFWKRMTEAFGYKWTSQYGDRPTKLWIDMISFMPNEKISHGLAEMLKIDEKWPPDVRQFYHLCQSYQPKLKALTHSISRKELLAQRTQTEHIRIKEITRIRGIL